MLRRDFIKTTGAVIATAALHDTSILASAPAPSSRLVLPINRGWRFKTDRLEGAEKPDFDDASFERIVIPHTTVRLPWHNFDDAEYQLLSTYRRRFCYPAGADGKRVFVDFEGVMTSSTVWINGHALGEYKGGFTPFSFELTPYLRKTGENTLVVQVDSTERSDIPPFGYEVDYMTFGGIYREVSLRVVPESFLDNIFARPLEVLSASPSLEVDCFLASSSELEDGLSLEVELLDQDRVIAKKTSPIQASRSSVQDAAMAPITNAPDHLSNQTRNDPARHTIALHHLSGIELWTLERPQLYTVRVKLLRSGVMIDEDTRRIGFREAIFTEQGFSLNGKIVKLRGLDRHQTFPYVGQAMPARVQRQDARILRQKFHCNIVRTSHYPQSRHFLDCCDEIGLLVLEEIPGWQHIGAEPWKEIAIDNVGRMIRRDWNHPSIILWGVRINESADDHGFYTRTNDYAHALDPTRQTGGIRASKDSELLEDVFTINDFDFPLREPNHPLYLNTEFVGHTYPTKTTDDDERQREHTLRHARIHNQLASNPQYAGGIGWCAFDYNTHVNFGSGDRICYHGVADIFREPKPAAGFYKSQCDPAVEVVLEPAFHWAKGDEAIGFKKALVCSNCDHLKCYLRERSDESNPWKLIAEVDPDRTQFAHLKYPPFLFKLDVLDSSHLSFRWGDLRIDGYIGGKQVISRTLSGRGVNSKLRLLADDHTLMADGADATRIVIQVTDEFGNVHPSADDPVTLTLKGPCNLIGDNPLALVGGTAAVWVRAQETAGTAWLSAHHLRLGTQTIELTLKAAPTELV
jgi:beta-galactosidase